MNRLYSKLLAALWTGILLSGGVGSAADAGDGTNARFSIHVASFKELKNANAFVNSLQKQGKIVFWKGAQVRNKGYYYRIFTGRYESYAEAEEVWRLLKSKGQVSYKGIFRFRELLPGMKPEGHGEDTGKAPPVSSAKMKSARPGHGRFVDNRDGTVTDCESGLMWIRNGWHRDFISAVTWDEAIARCRRFKAGGHADWTLPTKAQWQSLLDDHIQAPAIVEPNPFRNAIIHMPYWAKDGPIRLLSRRYTTLLYTGRIGHQQKTELAFIWPVRAVK